jgi:hypothetical protein
VPRKCILLQITIDKKTKDLKINKIAKVYSEQLPAILQKELYKQHPNILAQVFIAISSNILNIYSHEQKNIFTLT